MAGWKYKCLCTQDGNTVLHLAAGCGLQECVEVSQGGRSGIGLLVHKWM